MEEKSAPRVDRDPIYNDPAPVEIAGIKIIVRELKKSLLRRHVRTMFAAIGEIRARHPELADLGDNPGSTVISAIMGDLEALSEKMWEMLDEMVEASTGLSAEQQGDLPWSAYCDIVGLVLEAQKPGLDAFFRLRGKAAVLAGRALPGTDGSAKP